MNCGPGHRIDQTETWRVRSATSEDGAFLQTMLYEAAFWQPDQPKPSMAAALADVHLVRYIAGWPLPGDAGVVAEDGASRPIGASWYRFFSSQKPGYGYVDAAIPELCIAVVSGHRARGIGKKLLVSLLVTARHAGVPALSLSVAQANPAVAMYERLGFRRVAVEGNSWTMELDLDHRPTSRRWRQSRRAATDA